MTRRIAHLSDLHFGKCDESLVGPLLAALGACRPDLVVISGDLTQRATAREFAMARSLLDSLEAPALVVPGNHDIPLWNAGLRFLAPRRRWSRGLGLPWTASWQDDELGILGLDTPRPWQAKGGTLSDDQCARIERWTRDLPNQASRVLVIHHPLAIPSSVPGHHPPARQPEGTHARLRACGVDMVLSGHMHVGGMHHVVETERTGLLQVIAPSAISSRLRGEVNGFHVIDVEPGIAHVTLQALQPGTPRLFVAEETVSHALHAPRTAG